MYGICMWCIMCRWVNGVMGNRVEVRVIVRIIRISVRTVIMISLSIIGVVGVFWS